MRLVIDANVAFSLFLQPDSEELNIVASAPQLFSYAEEGKDLTLAPQFFLKPHFLRSWVDV